MEPFLLRNRLRYVGTGSDLFGIYIVNMLLSIVTLGLYYPWAKAATSKYTYANTQLDNSPFQFHGTGKEIFMGFIKAVGIFILWYAAVVAAIFLLPTGLKIMAVIALYLAFLAFIPIAVHGALRYRLSRTSWQGIHFGYRGDRNELIALYFGQALLTIVTFGIYGFWFIQNFNRYTINNIRFGSAKMVYTGEGGTYFYVAIKGYGVLIGGFVLAWLFTAMGAPAAITSVIPFILFGVYSFWWGRDLFDYFVDNLAIEKDGQIYEFQSCMTVGTYASLLIVNILLLVFTLGLGAAWVTTRTLSTVMDNVLLDERFNVNELTQTETEYRDATGEDMADMMDIGLI